MAFPLHACEISEKSEILRREEKNTFQSKLNRNIASRSNKFGTGGAKMWDCDSTPKHFAECDSQLAHFDGHHSEPSGFSKKSVWNHVHTKQDTEHCEKFDWQKIERSQPTIRKKQHTAHARNRKQSREIYERGRETYHYTMCAAKTSRTRFKNITTKILQTDKGWKDRDRLFLCYRILTRSPFSSLVYKRTLKSALSLLHRPYRWFLFSGVLYEESIVPPHNFLELFMQNVDMKQLKVDKVDKKDWY